MRPSPDSLSESVPMSILASWLKKNVWMFSAGSERSGSGSSHRRTPSRRLLSMMDCEREDLDNLSDNLYYSLGGDRG